MNKDGKTYGNNFTVEIPAKNLNNGETVLCRAEWEGETFDVSSNTIINVVWPVTVPTLLSVSRTEPTVCTVSWQRDKNAKSITICLNATSEDTCTEIQVTDGTQQYEIEKLDHEESYSIWMYAANELSASHNTTKQQCAPEAPTTMGTTTTAALEEDLEDDGLNIAIIGGAAGGTLLLIIITVIVITVCIVRKMSHQDNHTHEDELCHTYANVDVWKTTSKFSASQPGTNNEENPI